VPWRLGRKEHVDERGKRHCVDGTIKERADLKQVVPSDLGPIRRRIEEFLEGIEDLFDWRGFSRESLP
jgi:hypothetical protein